MKKLILAVVVAAGLTTFVPTQEVKADPNCEVYCTSNPNFACGIRYTSGTLTICDNRYPGLVVGE